MSSVCPLNPDFDTTIFSRESRRKYWNSAFGLPSWNDSKLADVPGLSPVLEVARRRLSGYTDGRRLIVDAFSPTSLSIIGAAFGLTTSNLLYLESAEEITRIKNSLVVLMPAAVSDADLDAIARIASQNNLVVDLVVFPSGEVAEMLSIFRRLSRPSAAQLPAPPEARPEEKAKNALLKGAAVSWVYRSPRLSDEAVAGAVREMVHAAMRDPEYWWSFLHFGFGDIFELDENSGAESEFAELIRLLDGVRQPGGQDTLFMNIAKVASRYSASAGTALLNSLGVAASLFVSMNTSVGQLEEMIKSMSPGELAKKVVEPACAFVWRYLIGRDTLTTKPSWSRRCELRAASDLLALAEAMFPGVDVRSVLRNVGSNSTNLSPDLAEVLVNLGLLRYEEGRLSLAPITEWLLAEGW